MKSFFRELKEGLIISFRAISANKMRSILATLGIIIGVWAVSTMSMAIRGINISFQEGVSSLGSDNLYIDKWAWFDNSVPWWELRNRKNLDMEEFEKFAEMVTLPEAVAPSIWTRQTAAYEDNRVEFININGTTDNYIETTNLDFEQGRFFNELESDGNRNVAVLGFDVAEQLFPRGGTYLNTIKIKGMKFRVVGILQKQGSWVMGNFNPDNQIFVPIGTVFKYMQRESFRSVTFNVRAPNSASVNEVKEEAIGVMRAVRGLSYDENNDFSINQQDGLLSEIDSTVGTIQIGALVITALALFVGGIGIMNIMFVSVKERTKEIGIRKAIGAKRRTILSQFISEAAVICLIGGLIGFMLASLTSLILNNFIPATIEPDIVAIAILVSVTTGVLSGFAPAFTASKMDPVEALRYE